MNTPRLAPVLFLLALTTPLGAQNAGQPLNLKLPPSDLPAAASTATASGNNTTAAGTRTAPGVYYGDTSGRMGNVAEVATTAPACDDSTYNKPQVHGSVGTGVVSGRHMGTGTWTGGSVNIRQAFGSCDDPGGGVSISVSGSRGHFRGR